MFGGVKTSRRKDEVGWGLELVMIINLEHRYTTTVINRKRNIPRIHLTLQGNKSTLIFVICTSSHSPRNPLNVHFRRSVTVHVKLLKFSNILLLHTMLIQHSIIVISFSISLVSSSSFSPSTGNALCSPGPLKNIMTSSVN